ncbi:MAG: hypothetical protein QM608_19070 [Caulobacter sp.]
MAVAKKGASLAQRLDVAARVLVGVVGSYVLTAVATGLLARLLPLEPTERVMTATLISFALYATLICLAFSVKRTLPLAVGVAATAAALGAVLSASIHQWGRL